MMVSVHAAVGAMLGAGIKNPLSAIVGGASSHLLCDLVPHKDYDIKIEAPLALAMFTYIGWRFGLKSRQFWGAVGAVLPDAENALALLGFIREDQTFFPTHNKSASWYVGHGNAVDSPIPQVALALISLVLADSRR